MTTTVDSHEQARQGDIKTVRGQSKTWKRSWTNQDDETRASASGLERLTEIS